MMNRAFLLAALTLAARGALAQAVAPNSTFANPIDIDYRFMVDSGPSRREAADPVITLHGDDYFLFASKSGGYWYSPDMRAWTLVVPRGFDVEAYAPSVMTIDGRLYYTAHKLKALYTTDDPKAGAWRKVADLAEYADPDLFVDDDGRVYLYYGSALNGGISVVELDPKRDFAVVAGPTKVMSANYADHGWERSGPDNLGAKMTEGFRIAPYVEGSWMTKHDGRYYLQYAAPGTVWKTYADGVYTSTSPTSGFTYAPFNPFSYKPGGFIGGAGHSGTFKDKNGRYWRVTTMIVSVAHKFERRLGIFPAGFDADGVMRTDTYLGDYPQFLPGIAATPLDGNRPGWMLLSGGKPATASSTVDGHGVSLAVDEDIRTQWSARTGDAGEWLRIDLGGVQRVSAVQVNLGELDTRRALGRTEPVFQQWLLEGSSDGQRWFTIADRRTSTADRPHAYVQLDAPRAARYVRLTNTRAAAGGTFAVRDLRVFGAATGPLPGEVRDLTVTRDTSDTRTATLTWSAAPNARRYVVRFGVSPRKLYGSYEVDDVTRLTINALDRGVTYYFTVDAVNERGVTRGTIVR